MCGLCGALGGAGDWTQGVASEAATSIPWQRRQARRERIAQACRVLRPFGLSLAEWQGSAMLLRSRTGATQIVRSLLDTWPAAERMAGRPLDPLDPALLEALRDG